MTPTRAAIATALAATLTALCSPEALAQAPTEPDAARAEEARALFDSAVEEVRRGRFPSARDQFRRSLELLPTSSTAFNLAVALNGTGQTVEAVALLDALLAGEYGDLATAERTQVEDLLARARADLAHLRLRVRGPDRARIRVDGEEAGEATASAPLELTVDAGRHVIHARAPDHEPTEAVIDLARGDTRETTLTLAPSPTPTPTRPPEDDTTLWETPLPWIVLAVVVLGAGATAYLLTRDRTADPVRDPIFGHAEVLRF